MNPEFDKIKQVGSILFRGIINGPVRNLYYGRRPQASDRGAGLRWLLSLDPSISDLPWEIMNVDDEFIAVNPQTRIVRYQPSAEFITQWHDDPPFRVLAVISNPISESKPHAADVKAGGLEVLRQLVARGVLEATFIEGHDTWPQLVRALDSQKTHVLYFVAPTTSAKDGRESVLIMEDAASQPQPVSGERLGSLLRAHPSVRLLALSCDPMTYIGAQSNIADNLVRSGAPAVLAISQKMGEDAAGKFFRKLYGQLVMGGPADVAVAEARREVFWRDKDNVEWAVPVLATQVRDSRLFDFGRPPKSAKGNFQDFEIEVSKTADNEYAVRARCGMYSAETVFINPFIMEVRSQIRATTELAIANAKLEKLRFDAAERERVRSMPPFGSRGEDRDESSLLDEIAAPSRRPQPAEATPTFAKETTAETADPSSDALEIHTQGPVHARPGDYSPEGWVEVMYRRGLTEMERSDWPRAKSTFKEILSVMKERRGTGYRDAADLLAICERHLAASKPKPIYLDENVQFTVYRPKKIKPLEWYSLLAYAHLSERAPDRPDEIDPVEKMQGEVKRILGEEELKRYTPATEDSSQAVPREGEITFVPSMEGVEFNPRSCSFLWLESVHGQEFRMRASPDLDGKTTRGRMSVFLGAILLADINLSIQVNSVQALDADEVKLEPEQPARPYRNIFPSYSHKDLEIVAQIEQYAQVSGDKYLRDVNELRSGQNWKEWMKRTIAQADIFQLFWSTNSMRSENVRLEWEQAIALQRPHFIRPTYWEEPLPKSPAENLPPPELKDLYFQPVRHLVKIDSAPERAQPSRRHSSASCEEVRLRAAAEEARRLAEVFARHRAEEEERQRAAEEVRRKGIASEKNEQKRCPTCNRIYSDMSNFCLEDGAPLSRRPIQSLDEPLASIPSLPSPTMSYSTIEPPDSHVARRMQMSERQTGFDCLPQPSAGISPPKKNSTPIIIGILLLIIVGLFILGVVIVYMLK